MKMKKSKVTVFIAAAVATAAFTFFGTDNIFAKSQKTQTIKDGVYIGSVDVGGMTKNEAKTALNDYIESIDNTTFTLQGANGSVDATAAEMSIKSDASAAVDEAMGVGRTGNLINRFVQSKKLENSPKRNLPTLHPKFSMTVTSMSWMTKPLLFFLWAT